MLLIKQLHRLAHQSFNPKTPTCTHDQNTTMFNHNLPADESVLLITKVSENKPTLRKQL